MYQPTAFKTRPAEIEAMRIIPGSLEAQQAAFEWVASQVGTFNPETESPKKGVAIDPSNGKFVIATNWGNKVCEDGDWIVKTPKGIFYPYKPGAFRARYERVES